MRGCGQRKTPSTIAGGVKMERMMGVEPTYQPWEGRILPMNYIRIFLSACIVYHT